MILWQHRMGNLLYRGAKILYFGEGYTVLWDSVGLTIRQAGFRRLGETDQVYKGSCFGLLHDVGAVELDRPLARSELVGNLLICHAGYEERKEFIFS